jgi:hypothetical protein
MKKWRKMSEKCGNPAKIGEFMEIEADNLRTSHNWKLTDKTWKLKRTKDGESTKMEV